MQFLFFQASEAYSLGRANISNMSDQARMELLVADIQNISALKNNHGDFLDIKEWHGVDLDSSGSVQRIDLQEMDGIIGPGGSIDLQWIPLQTKCFQIVALQLAGSLDSYVLPRSLEDFVVLYNALAGEIEWKGFPTNLQNLNIAGNHFAGSVSFEDVPRGLTVLNVSSNRFVGRLDWKALPRSLQHLSVAVNAFQGTITFEELPESLAYFDASQAQFSGHLDLTRLPKALTDLHLYDNAFMQPELRIDFEEHPYLSVLVDKPKFEKILNKSGNDVWDFVN